MNTLLAITDFIVYVVLQWVIWLLIAYAVVSWLVAFNVVNTHNDFVRQLLTALSRMTEPLYRPIRRIMPDFGALDFSPMVVLLIIYILRNIVLPRLAVAAMGG